MFTCLCQSDFTKVKFLLVFRMVLSVLVASLLGLLWSLGEVRNYWKVKSVRGAFLPVTGFKNTILIFYFPLRKSQMISLWLPLEVSNLNIKMSTLAKTDFFRNRQKCLHLFQRRSNWEPDTVHRIEISCLIHSLRGLLVHSLQSVKCHLLRCPCYSMWHCVRECVFLELLAAHWA